MPYKDVEKRRARVTTYDVTHRRERQVYNAAYCISHREANNTRTRTYRSAHRAKYRAKYAAYYALHKEETRVRVERHRARKRGLPNTLTAAQWNAIKVAYGFRCAYCGKKPKQLTQDHVLPLMNGGGTTPDNIVPACLNCNSGKGARPPHTIPPIRLLL